MQGERRVAHAAHQDLRLVVRERDLRARGLLYVLDAVVEDVVARPAPSSAPREKSTRELEHALLLLGQRRDEVLDAGDEDVARRRDEAAHERDEVRHRLVHGAPEDARVQVARGARDRQLVVRQAAQAVREAGRARVQPVVVRLARASARGMMHRRRTYDADGVDALEVLPRLALDELVEALRAALLHALEAEAQVHGERQAERLVRLEHVHPPEDGALVVRRPAPDQLPALLVDDELERLRVPAVALQSLAHTTWSEFEIVHGALQAHSPAGHQSARREG